MRTARASSAGSALLYPSFYPTSRTYCTAGIAKSGGLKRKWKDVSSQRKFVEQMESELGIREKSDWYKISRYEIETRGGSTLLRHYRSLWNLLATVYPDYAWQRERFAEAGKAPNDCWKDKASLMRALDAAEKRLGIQKIEDWYSVTLTDLKGVGFPYYLPKMKLVQLLSERYPDYKWEKVYLLKGRYAQQKRLERAVNTLFPQEEIKINARKEAQLLNPVTNYYYELDVFIPRLGLAFEYQDVHHYKSAGYAYETLDVYRTRDSVKQKLAQEKGITLLAIPFWWDGKDESLIATIKKHRPDLLQGIASSSPPIPEEMPASLMDQYKRYEIEDIGEPMTACFLTGADKDPTNWWMFEKYDGVRAFWNPLKKAFYSRFGKRFTVPDDVIASMPQDIFLDGELWFGRESFREASKISSRKESSAIDWHSFRYMVFDIPRNQGTYQERYNMLAQRLENEQHPYIKMAPKIVCNGIQHLEEFFQDVIDKGGEGVILRDPFSPYKPGRSPGYLKHKKFRDAEAKVVACVGPQLWECILPDGVTFTAPPGTTEFSKRHQLQVGDIVSFKHSGFLLGSQRPKSPALYRVRTDITWDDVVRNWKDQKTGVTAYPVRRPTVKHRPQGYWLEKNNRREFFLKAAEEMSIDPYKPEDWEKVTTNQIAIKEGGGSILNIYNGSLKEALRNTFPELQFDVNKRRPSGYWENIENRKQFFCEFAKDMGFDPMQAENWEKVQNQQLQAREGGKSLLGKYSNNLQNALESTFPDMQFEVLGKRKPRGYWLDASNRKSFFCAFANEKGFDPLQPDNWASVTNSQILAKEGGKSLLNIYNGSLKQALRSCSLIY